MGERDSDNQIILFLDGQVQVAVFRQICQSQTEVKPKSDGSQAEVRWKSSGSQKALTFA